MRLELSEKFDSVMSGLKAIEPGPAFDLEFKRRLNEAIAEKYAPSLLERIAGRFAESADSIRRVLVPETHILIRTIATFVIVCSVGIYVYSTQPAIPVITSQEGIVTTQGPLRPGSVITIAPGAQADIELPDRYVIRIKDKATLKVVKLTPRFGNGRAVFELIEGKALVDIDRGFKGSQFIIDTNAGAAKALGTKFFVDASGKKTKVGVLEGKVEVKNRREAVIVKSGQKTEVDLGNVPKAPQRLNEKEWLGLEELYQIGRSPRVVLLLKNTPDRVVQLLRPCPIYISGESRKEIPGLLESALRKIGEAIKEGDDSKHLDAIKMLERVVMERQSAKYNAQLLMYVGAYYEYIADHQNAVRTFEKVEREYRNSTFASLALCAIGLIYEEKLSSPSKAEKVYHLLLNQYPDSLEALWIENRLGIKKV